MTPFLKEHQTALSKAVEKLGEPNATDDDILPALVGVCGSVLAALGPGGPVVVGVAATVVAKRVLSSRSKSKLRKAIAELSAEEKQREILMPLFAAILEEIRATRELDPEQRQGLATALEEIRAVQDLSLVVLNKLDGIYERPCPIALQANAELGPYRLVHELGRGRFAHVWRGMARGRKVTLKILRSGAHRCSLRCVQPGERLRRDEELEALECGDTIKAVIQKATARVPEDRFQTIAEFLAKLEVACKDTNLGGLQTRSSSSAPA